MTEYEQTILPAGIVGMLCRAAEAKGMLRGRREAILARLEEMAEGLFPAGDLFAGVFADGGCREPVAGYRDIGDSFLGTAFASVEKRQLTGSYYTPVAVIDRILDLVWENLFPGGATGFGRRATVCDPAMGCGYFLLRAAERLLTENPGLENKARSWVRSCVFGVDKDPAAVFMTRVLLWLSLSERGREFIPPAGHFVCGDALLGPAFGQSATVCTPDGVAWESAFPEVGASGFGAVVGNPPYEVLTNFARHPERRMLADALRKSGMYRDALQGQVNLYRCFIERSLALLRPGGSLSMIVPLSLARDSAARDLRSRLIREEAAEQWFLFGERDAVFSGVTQSACIFKAVRGGGAASTLVAASSDGTVRWTVAELEEAGEGMPIPALGRRGAELWRWLRKHCRGTVADAADMRVGEVDQTFFRECMRDDDTGCILARGAHLAPFRLDARPIPGRERFLDLPLFLEKKGASAEACRERAETWRVAQLGIRNMHSRPRLVAALLPPGVYAGNSLNLYAPRNGLALEYLAGVLNSRLLDWAFRLGSGNNNINLHEMRRLPFPASAPAADQEAVAAAYRKCAEAAGDVAALRKAREALDEAVEVCYGMPEKYAACLETNVMSSDSEDA